jgi:hypothetical protein
MNTGTTLRRQRKQELLLGVLDHQGLLDASQDELARHRARSFGRIQAGAGLSYYPRSLFTSKGLLFLMAHLDNTLGPDSPVGQDGQGDPGNGSRRLYVISKDRLPGVFEGSSQSLGGRQVFEGELTYDTYLAAAEYLPFMKPSSLRDKTTTIGCGDRLGASNPGHIRAARGFAVSPVLAQQSIRELTLTGRTYPQVVRDAAFSVLQEGFDKPYGADGDHLKTLADIDVALAAGMPMITLDLTEVMNPAPAQWSDDAVDSAFLALPQAVQNRVLQDYAGKTFNLGSTALTIPAPEARRCALMYWKALDFTAEVDARLRSKRGDAYDLEVSIDETTAPTVPSHHLFIASELKRRMVTVNSLAPRFIGEFQKGIDYIGDLAEFERQFIVHCEIAKAFGGYKVSIHSGSDKFSAYPIIGKHTGLRVHVKTAGTSWLEALRAVSLGDPVLFRDLLAKAYQYYPEALKLYHITPDLAKIPDIQTVIDGNLPDYLGLPESRQLLHVTYGGLLGDAGIGKRFFAFLDNNEELHYHCVATHLRRHIQLLGVQAHG